MHLRTTKRKRRCVTGDICCDQKFAFVMLIRGIPAPKLDFPLGVLRIYCKNLWIWLVISCHLPDCHKFLFYKRQTFFRVMLIH